MSFGLSKGGITSIVEDNIDTSKRIFCFGESVLDVLDFLDVELDSRELGGWVLSLKVVENFWLPGSCDDQLALRQEQFNDVSSETRRRASDCKK